MIIGLLVWGGSTISVPPPSEAEPGVATSPEFVPVDLGPVLMGFSGFGTAEEFHAYVKKAHEDDKDYVTVEAVQEQTSFQFRTPTLSGYEVPTHVYRIRWKTVSVFFGDYTNDVHMSAEARGEMTPDFSADREMMGGLKDHVQVFTVRGVEAMGWEPFKQGYLKGGRVVWWEDGVLYSVIGGAGDNPTRLAELRAIVESMQ